MQGQAENVMTRETITDEVERVLRSRMWIHPEQVRARVDEGTVTLTGAVGRRSTADIAVRLAGTVPGVSAVVNRIGYDVDDADLIRSRVNQTHPFSAEPFHPAPARL